MKSSAFSFIHCADLHLDSPFEGIHVISENVANVLRDATFKSFDNIINLAINEKVDFIVIAGDVYDGADRSLRAQWRFHQALRRATESGIQCFLAHGNHDPLSGWEAGLRIPEGAFRFGCDNVEYAIAKHGKNEIARVYGISYPTREINNNLAIKFPKSENDLFSIGILHCNIGGSKDHDNYAPCSVEDLLTCGMDYWALGHIHTRNMLRENKPCIIYPGNTQGRSVREPDARGCYLVKVSDRNEIHTEFVPTDVVRWFVEEINISEFETLDKLIDELHERRDDIRSYADGRSAMLRFYLTGRGEIHNQIGRAIPEIILTLREGEGEDEHRQFVWVESIQSQTKPTIDISKRRQAEDFVGEFLKAADSLRNNPDFVSEILRLITKHSEHKVIADQLGELTKEDLLSILDEAEIKGLDFLLPGED